METQPITVYLAQNGLDAAGIDISKTALQIAKKKTCQAKAINFLNESFVDLSFRSRVFDFIYDMGCFHHVQVEERSKFIAGVHRVLKEGGLYMLTAFSSRNGQGWNHFTKQQIMDLFHERFEIEQLRNYSSLEATELSAFSTML